MDWLPLVLFATVFLIILSGYPVAFTLGGLSVLAGLLVYDADFFYLLILRIYGTMNNIVLMAVPLFIFMGIMLERSGLAESLLETMAFLFRRVRGGLAISVVVVGAMLAASTGIVGATVVTMGLISLPTMMRYRYSLQLASGTIAASGTLGQIIPPSILLVLLGSVLQVSVGDLFLAAVLPGFGLVACYMLYIFILANFYPKAAPSMTAERAREFRKSVDTRQLINTFLLPLVLIFLVLGSIFAGIASPTEAAGIGAFGATVLTILQKKLSQKVLREVTRETLSLTAMVFGILIGAAAFALVFRGLHGDDLLIQLIRNAALDQASFILLIMIIMFLAGFFIDFIEIIFIIVPVVMPLFVVMGVDLLWIGILIAVNLQTSFLTPPFGFSLFYLRGVAPPELTTRKLYLGILPFVLIQLIFLFLIYQYPEWITWLPSFMND